MERHLIRLLADDEGATLAEYCLLIFLIAAVCVTVVTLFGHKVSNLFVPVSSAL